jgi:preprotein translocase subunit SecG
MQLFLTILHICLSFMLILIIILQPGKGVDGGAILGGGGSSTIFGPRGPASILGRATGFGAALFMGTSVLLAFYSDKTIQAGSDIADEILKLQQEQAVGSEGSPSMSPTPGFAIPPAGETVPPSQE